MKTVTVREFYHNEGLVSPITSKPVSPGRIKAGHFEVRYSYQPYQVF
jgi:hypothetical protein